MFFTTAGGRDASDKYHKSRFWFWVFSKKQGALAPADAAGAKICFEWHM
jgi:hypothetical protein